MPSGDIPWNRKSVCLVFIPQGLLSFFIFLVASVDVGLSRRWIATYNDYYDEPEEGEYRSHWDSSPAQYPYAFSLFWIALATFLTTLITFILALRRKASPIAVAIVTFLWALGWLALFGYGIYEFHSFQISFFCSDYGIGAACGAYITEFICFLLSPFEAIINFGIFSMALRARSRQRKGVTTSSSAPQYQAQPQPQYGYGNQNPYQQQPQYPMAQSSPSGMAGPPNPAQPFYQNGTWYQYQSVPVPVGGGGDGGAAISPPAPVMGTGHGHGHGHYTSSGGGGGGGDSGGGGTSSSAM